MRKPIREIRIDGNIAYVPLTRGYEAIIDAEDVPIAEGKNWRAMPKGRTIYAVTTVGPWNGKRTAVYIHTAISGYAITDHADGDGLNNRRKNLRDVSWVQNNQNVPRRASNPLQMKGASFRSDVKKWRSSIKANGKNYYLGLFDTEEEAHEAYCYASARLHGRFGRLT